MSKRAERRYTVQGRPNYGHRGKAVLLFIVMLGALFVASGAFAAKPNKNTRILVLPFAMNAEDAQTSESDFASMLGRRIGANGVTVVPDAKMREVLKSRNVSSLDTSTVRALAAAAGATHAVYGSINQAGNALSIDARLVPAKASEHTRPVFVEQSKGQANIGYAMDELAGAVVTSLPAPSAAAVAATPAADTALPATHATSRLPAGRGIAGVEVRGTKILDPDVVLMRVSSRRGDTPDATTIDQELKQIWDLGYFSDVQVNLEPRSDGTYLVYTVKEKPRVESINVEGTDEIDADDVVGAMATKQGSILNESVLSEDIAKVLDLYRKKGHYLAKVDPVITPSQNGSTATLDLKISEGKQLYIQEVSIDGAKDLDQGDVKDQLMLKERNIISWMTGTGILKEELIERDSSAISAYYLDRGYMDVTVAAPRIDYKEDGIHIAFPINEGPRYTLGQVTFDGDLIDSEDALRAVITSDEIAASGGAFNLSAMQADNKALTEFYADRGYAFADITSRPQKQPGSDVVNIEYGIQKRNRIYVRTVLVEGNEKTRNNVILREMRLTDGEAFDGAKLRRSTERLNRLGYFEVAEAELVPTENADEVDLKVKVKEQPTGALMAGIGYSTFSSVGVAATIMERNLWGKGYQLSLQSAFSGKRSAYTLSFMNPRFNDTDLSVGFDLYHWRDDYVDYTKRTLGGVVRFGIPLGEYTTLTWGYRLDRYKIYDLEDDVSDLIRRYANDYRLTSVGLLRLVRDSTGMTKGVPVDGNVDILAAEYGGGILGGDDDFVTLSADHHSYYQIKPGHVLHGRIKGQIILENGSDEVPVFERFWMGGMNSVRGYNSRDIVPRDPKTGDRIGGTRMAFTNLEYIYTLNEDVGLYLVPFFDAGFNIDADRDYKWSDEILKSAGLELRWRSPMGDLRFSYGIPFDEDRNGKRPSGRFEFSMGQMF